MPRIRRMRIKEKKKKEHCELDHNKPVIKGDAIFSGIALIDNDPYIPGGNVNGIPTRISSVARLDLAIDLTAMPRTIFQGDQ